MTAAVHRSSSSFAVPPSQNTAPVLEFKCLYTHDVRRKQKRWQDGFLKFHTFNRRVMVYDVVRNFIGDTHCVPGQELQEGDEISLEKGGVIVQISEAVGRTETDLTELFQARTKASPKRPASPLRGRSTPLSAGTTSTPYAKHKSLTALLGISRGPLGKAALPIQSPFEQHAHSNEMKFEVRDRSRKRQKVGERVPPEAFSRPQESESKSKRERHLALTKHSEHGNGQRMDMRNTSSVNEVICLLSDSPEPPSQTRIHPTYLDGPSELRPPTIRAPKTRTLHMDYNGSKPANAATAVGHPEIDESVERHKNGVKEHLLGGKLQAIQKRGASNEGANKSSDSALLTTDTRQCHAGQRTSSSAATTIDTTSIDVDNTHATELLRGRNDDDVRSASKGASLKLVSSAPRKMLICQEQLSRKPTRKKVGDLNPADIRHQSKSPDDCSPIAPHRQWLQARLSDLERRAMQRVPKSLEYPALPATTRRPQDSMADDVMRPSHPVLADVTNNPASGSSLKQGGKANRVATDNTLSMVRGAPDAPKHNPMHQSTTYLPPPIAQQGEELASKSTRRSKGMQKQTTNVDSRSAAAPITATLLAKPFKAPSRPGAPTETIVDNNSDCGPWSKEAFDLFDWRPPEKFAIEIEANHKDQSIDMNPSEEAPLGLSGGVDAPVCRQALASYLKDH